MSVQGRRRSRTDGQGLDAKAILVTKVVKKTG